MLRSVVFYSWCPFFFILLTSCGGDEKHSCGLVEKLVSCDMISKDALKACASSTLDLDPKERALAECGDKCTDKASCADVTEGFCAVSGETGEDVPVGEQSSLRACWNECFEKFAPYTCDGGAKYSEFDRCDGFERCEDGADEKGCPTFACKSGEEVSSQKKCDGSDDCDDASDEAGCPTFRCDDGATVKAFDKCDGTEDCKDGSDEMGCVQRDFEVMCPMDGEGQTNVSVVVRVY